MLRLTTCDCELGVILRCWRKASTTRAAIVSSLFWGGFSLAALDSWRRFVAVGKIEKNRISFTSAFQIYSTLKMTSKRKNAANLNSDSSASEDSDLSDSEFQNLAKKRKKSPPQVMNDDKRIYERQLLKHEHNLIYYNKTFQFLHYFRSL